MLDPAGKPLAGLEIRAEDQMLHQFTGSGRTDTNGLYYVGLREASWQIAVQNDSLFGLSVLVKPEQVTVAGNQFQRVDLKTKTISAHLRGRLVDDQHQPLSDFNVQAQDPVGGWSSESRTAGDGTFDLGLFGGTWNLFAHADSESGPSYIAPQLSLLVQDNIDQNNLSLVALRATAQITAIVRDVSGHGISNLNLYGKLALNGLNYYVNAQTDGNGQGIFNVANGPWNVGINCQDLQPRQFQCVTEQTVLVTAGNQTVTFTPPPAGNVGPQIVTSSLPNGDAGKLYQASIQATGGQPPLVWSLAPRSALPAGLTLNSGDTATIQGTPTQAGTFQFVIRVTDSIGRSFDRLLALTINGNATAPKFTRGSRFVNGKFQLEISGQAGATVAIESSSDLLSWEPLFTLPLSGATTTYMDVTTAPFPRRFYRLKKP